MSWVYVQETGELLHNDAHVAFCYAGHGQGVNNPALQAVPFVGPLPCGRYRIGLPHEPPEHMGPLAFPLIPDPSNEMFHRIGFFLHGDTPAMNRTASSGCIVASLVVRQTVAESPDRELIVVAHPAAKAIATS